MKKMLNLDQDKTPSLLWRGINFTMAVFFALAAHANVNDDDWYIWVPMYGIPALLCVSAVGKPSVTDNQFWRGIISFILCTYLLYGVYQVIALLKIMATDFKNPLAHEEGREFGGLLIIITWTGTTYFSSPSSNRDANTNQKFVTATVWITASLAIISLFSWSLCFVSDWHKHLGHCNNMFKT